MTSSSLKSSAMYATYSSPHIITVWLIAPISIIQGIYAKYYDLSLSAIAAVVLIARLFDAISDPLIGYYADSYYQRTGSYKSFIFSGALLFIVSSYFLYVPPDEVGILYFSTWFILVYLAWTLFEIPHASWASQLAQESEKKSLVYSFRSATGYLGQIAFYAIPLLPIFETGEITPDTLRISVVVASMLMLPSLYCCLKFVPNRISPRVNQNCSLNSGSFNEIRSLLHSITTNKPFLIFLGATVTSGLASGIWFGLIFIFVDVYLGMGDQFSRMFLLAFFIGIITTPIWYKLSVCLGKKKAWVLSMLFIIFSFIYTSAMAPGNTHPGELVALKIIQTIGFSCVVMVGPAMLSEIIDYSNWKYGQERASTYFAFYGFVGKSTTAIAIALGLGLVSWYGFDATASTQTEAGIRGLSLAMTWIPVFFASLSLIFVLLCPIDARRHSIICQCLDKRSRRSSSIAKKQTEPVTTETSCTLTSHQALNTPD